MLSIGQNIQMEPVEELHNGNETVAFNTEVTYSDEESGLFRIKKPTLEANIDADILREDARFYMIIVEEDGEVYQFESNILKYDQEADEFTLQLPEQVKRIQRRAYVRADLTVPVTIDGTYEVKTQNLSGGGMHLIMSLDHQSYEVDDMVKGKIHLADKEPIEVVSKIVRLEEDEQDNLQHIYVSFTEIEEAKRREIVYYCFQKHIEEYRSQR